MAYKDKDARREYQREYSRTSQVRKASRKAYEDSCIKFSVRISKNTEQDMYEHVSSIENKSGYVKDLIRKDMEG